MEKHVPNNKSNNSPKRINSFGIMCNSLYLEHWQSLTIQYLINKGIQLKLIILNYNTKTKRSFTSKILHYQYNHLLFNIYNRFILKPKSKQSTSIKNLVSDNKIIYCKTEKGKFTDRFLPDDIIKITDHKLDFILRFGFNILKGDILKCSTYGIWSFHHDDEQKYRGGPPGFWEIYKNDPVNGIILQQLTENLDAGIILKKGYYRTIKHSYSANIDQIYYQSVSWPLQVCNSIENNTFKSYESKTNVPIYHIPSNLKMLRFLCLMVCNKIRFHLNELFRIEDWNVAFCVHPVDYPNIELNNRNLTWFTKKSKKEYLADPFLFKYNNDIFLLIEKYSYKNRKGNITISKFNPESKNFGNFQTALNEPFHLAYPFVFKHDNTIYMIPESFEKKQIRLYRFLPEKMKFAFEKILVDKIDAIDSTLVNHENMWYLFFTKKDNPSVNLYIYYSKNLFDEFKPHKNNPVKTDVCSSRPAGKFVYINNILYRPVQDNAGTYGKKIVINKVEKLTPDLFEESYVNSISPVPDSDFNKGIHTINRIDNLIVIDGKRFVFLWSNLYYQIGNKIEKFFHK